MTSDRLTDMLERYGEVCKRTVAARILGITPETVSAMLRDGRLETACAGAMVDVRSIAKYIEAPAQANEAARVRRRREKRGIACRFSV